MEAEFAIQEKNINFTDWRVDYYKTESFKKIFQLKIIKSITEIVSFGFGKNGDLEDVKNHIFESDNIGLIYVDDKMVGFATTRNYFDIDLCYLHGIVVSTTHKGLGTFLLKKMFLNSEMSLCGFTTQNPAMYLTAKKCTSSLFPDPNFETSEDYVLLGKKLTVDRPGVYQKNMSIKNLYPDCLYEKIPKSNDLNIWSWWNNLVEIDNYGESKDGIVFIGKINY